MAKNRWTPEAREQQRERMKTENPTAQGVAARLNRRPKFDPGALTHAIANFILPDIDDDTEATST
jgi:hypothetical protein